MNNFLSRICEDKIGKAANGAKPWPNLELSLFKYPKQVVFLMLLSLLCFLLCWAWNLEGLQEGTSLSNSLPLWLVFSLTQA